jgi:hypothetical protein
MSTTVFWAIPKGKDGRRGKRTRQPMSCTTCRVSKRKCDRQQPCGTCISKGLPALCEFTTSQNAKTVRRDETQTRLKRLERMVSDAVKSRSNTSSINDAGSYKIFELIQETTSYTGSSSQSPDASTGGHLRNQGREAIYLGSTHWSAILEDIHDIKDLLLADDESSSDEPPPEKPDLVFGYAKPFTIDDVLATLPPRSTVTRLLAIYFDAKFQREFNAFWENPTSASFLWLSVLFSILSIASRIAATRHESETTAAEVAGVYLGAASQCLVVGKYQEDFPYAIEALVAYSKSKYRHAEDPTPSLWSTFTLATRLAQRMSYHRDSLSLSTKIPPFEMEMRRRLWFYVETGDTLFSSNSACRR